MPVVVSRIYNIMHVNTLFLLLSHIFSVMGISIPLFGGKQSEKQQLPGSGVGGGEVAMLLRYSEIGFFYMQITAGTPKEGEEEQVFNVYLDTGSCDIWIASKTMCDSFDCAGKTFFSRLLLWTQFQRGVGATWIRAHSSETNTFDPTRSTTYKELGNPFSIEYLDGTIVRGHLAEDTIKLPTTQATIEIKNGIFGEATYLKEETKNRNDGNFGMGIKSSPKDPNTINSPFYNLLKRANLPAIFSLYLDRQDDGVVCGELVLGGHDEGLVDSDFTFVDVVLVFGYYQGWRIPIQKISFGKDGMRESVIYLDNVLALVDSGAHYIHLSDKFYDDFLKTAFQEARFDKDDDKDDSFACKHTYNVLHLHSKLPDITFTIGGHDFVLTPGDYIIEDKSGYWCHTGFQSYSNPEFRHEVILGQTFMLKHYTIFDMEKRQVGFAKAKHGSD